MVEAVFPYPPLDPLPLSPLTWLLLGIFAFVAVLDLGQLSGHAGKLGYAHQLEVHSMSNNQISIIFMTLGVLCILAMAYEDFPVEDNILTFVGITFFVVGSAVTKFRNAGQESSAANDKSKGKS